MTYRNSLLSLYPPTPSTPKTKQDAGFEAQFDEELPATSPVFEGHLYLRTDKKQWQWRLFRFDGTCFTCLSTRKVKLPPNTRVDAPSNDQAFIHSLPSFTTTSLTSPLLATPKSKSRQHSTVSDSSPLAKYYQLPKWTVDISNISAVSVLKPSESNESKAMKLAMLSPSQKLARCFCIRTFDGNCYIMKAQKQKDLERWLFVLTKMWKFAQAMKHQLLSQQPQHQQIIRQQQTLGGGGSNNNIQHPFYLQLASQQQQHGQSQDSIPLSQMYHHRPRHASLIPPLSMETVNVMDNSLPIVTSPAAPSPLSGAVPANDHSPYTKSPLSGYEKSYQHPSLSVEKLECIDAWRQSLGELMASDPQLSISNPPPIESIPDDDQVSIISDMTSISHRKQPTAIRRRISISSSTSKRTSRSSNKVKLRDHHNQSHPPTPSVLKKKRSNDVKNWIEPRKTDKPTTTTPPPKSKARPPPLPLIDTYHVSYFQDCKTTARSTSSGSLDLNSNHHGNKGSSSSSNNSQMNDDSGNWISKKNTTTNKSSTAVMLDRHAKYHSSTRAKQIQIVDAHNPPASQQQIDTTVQQRPSSPSPSSSSSPSPSSSYRRQSHSPQQKQHSPSGNTSPPARRSLDNASNSARYRPSSFMAESPLHSLAHVEGTKNQDEEEISLADLQRSLKRASLQQQQHQQHTELSISPSSSSVKQSRHRHSYQQPTPHHYPLHPPVAAPAIPPVPYAMMNTAALMSRQSLLSSSGHLPHKGGKDCSDTYDLHSQQQRKWKDQYMKQNDPRPTSWMTSCEPQKVMQHRRSIHLDTAHW